MYIHVTLIPYIGGSRELKSKPTQHSVKELRSIGITPDVLVCRADVPIPEDIKDKLVLFCNVNKRDIIQNSTIENLYEVPLMLEKEGLGAAVCAHLGLEDKKPQLEKWEGMVKKAKALKNTVKIGLVGKYIALQDAYLSVAEALRHAGVVNNVDVSIKWIDSSLLTEANAKETLKDCEGISVPGGFGKRGIEGMITSIKYARENNVPFFGICLGMQMAVIEFARNILKLSDVNSTEFDKDCQNPVIDIMASQENLKNKGGTMRLGLYPCKLIDGAKVKDIYTQELIYERHRHRYEFNNSYRKLFEESGMKFCGISPDERLVEIIELPTQKWFIATQFHPEFKSRLDTPHPLFVDFIKSSKN